MGKRNSSSKKATTVAPENSGVGEDRPLLAPKKAGNEIDEIFAGKKRKKPEKGVEDGGEKADKLKKKKKKDKSTVAKENGFAEGSSKPKKKTADGLTIYTEEELGIGKPNAGGGKDSNRKDKGKATASNSLRVRISVGHNHITSDEGVQSLGRGSQASAPSSGRVGSLSLPRLGCGSSHVPSSLGRASSSSSVSMETSLASPLHRQDTPHPSQKVLGQTSPATSLPTHDMDTETNNSSGLRQELTGLQVNNDGSQMLGCTQNGEPPESSSATKRQGADIPEWRLWGFTSEEEFVAWENDKRQHVTTEDNAWHPYDVPKQVSKSMHAGYNEPWMTGAEVPTDVKDMWFAHFKKVYKWYPVDEPAIQMHFDKELSDRIKNAFNKGRQRGKKPSFTSERVWAQLLEKWATPEWQAVSQRNAANRRANPSTHRLGPIPMGEAKKRLEEQFGRPVTYADVFMRAHREGTDGPYTDPRAEETMARYEKLVQQATQASESSDSVLTPIDRNALFLQAIGTPRKGRIYGVGSQLSAASASHSGMYAKCQVTQEQVQEAVELATAPLHEELRKIKEESNSELRKIKEEQNSQLRALLEQITLLTARLPPPPPQQQSLSSSDS